MRGAAALFTRMSTGAPNASRGRATIAAAVERGVGEVGGDRGGPPAAARISATVSSSDPGQRVRARARGAAGDADRGTLGGEPLRDRLADAPAGAGHDGDASLTVTGSRHAGILANESR